MTENTIPKLTPEQRRKALEKAARARAIRAEIKERFAAGEITITEIIESDDEAIKRMKVIDLIQTIPGYGKVKAAKLLDEHGISQSRRIQGLGRRQKETLLSLFG